MHCIPFPLTVLCSLFLTVSASFSDVCRILLTSSFSFCQSFLTAQQKTALLACCIHASLLPPRNMGIFQQETKKELRSSHLF